MKSNIYEIANGIFRISVAPTDKFEFNHFLIVDEKCMLIHTGGKRVFDVLHNLVSELIPLEKLQYIAFSHFESDECGALNNWLKIAPNAIPITNEIGKATMDDFSDKKAEIVNDNQIIDLGRNKIQILLTPHIPHGWESMLFFEITNGILFSSDLGAQPGINIPVTTENLSDRILKFQEEAGFIPKGENFKSVIERLRKLKINYLATMHGSTLKGDQITSLFDNQIFIKQNL